MVRTVIVHYFGTLKQPVLSAMAAWTREVGAQKIQGVCSGSMRQEEAVRGISPKLSIRANDVTVIPVGLGRFCMGDRHAGFTFQGKWTPLNDSSSRFLAAAALARMIFFLTRRAKATVANMDLIMALVEDEYDRHDQATRDMNLAGYDECDFRDLIGGDHDAIIGAPPTFKGDYESAHKTIDAAIDWERPSFRTWDPSSFPSLVSDLREAGKPWLFAFEHYFEKLPLLAIHRSGGMRTVYIYGAPETKMFNSSGKFGVPLYAESIKPEDITADSKVDIEAVDAAVFKRICAAWHHNINTQPVMNGFIVKIDGKVAGGFMTTLFPGSVGSFTQSGLIGVDFAVSGKRRLSKLIPMLTRCDEVKRYIERTRLIRYRDGLTTVVIHKGTSPENYRSMKYRGSGYKYSKVTRPGLSSYNASWANVGMDHIFGEWYRRHACKG